MEKLLFYNDCNVWCIDRKSFVNEPAAVRSEIIRKICYHFNVQPGRQFTEHIANAQHIDIRKNILENFKDAKLEDIKESIKEAVKDKDEIVLPGLGVLFEILWNNSNDNQKNEILQNIYEGIKKYD